MTPSETLLDVVREAFKERGSAGVGELLRDAAALALKGGDGDLAYELWALKRGRCPVQPAGDNTDRACAAVCGAGRSSAAVAAGHATGGAS